MQPYYRIPLRIDRDASVICQPDGCDGYHRPFVDGTRLLGTKGADRVGAIREEIDTQATGFWVYRSLFKGGGDPEDDVWVPLAALLRVVDNGKRIYLRVTKDIYDTLPRRWQSRPTFDITAYQPHAVNQIGSGELPQIFSSAPMPYLSEFLPDALFEEQASLEQRYQQVVRPANDLADLGRETFTRMQEARERYDALKAQAATVEEEAFLDKHLANEIKRITLDYERRSAAHEQEYSHG